MVFVIAMGYQSFKGSSAQRLRLKAGWLFALILSGCVEDRGGEVAQRNAARQISSLPYVRSVAIAREDYTPGVVKHVSARCDPGVHIYVPADERRALLLDMDGQIVHTLVDKRSEPSGNWELVEPYRGGDFLVVVENRGLMRIDWDSHVHWELNLSFHHDVDIAENGDIYGVIDEVTTFPALLPQRARYDSLIIVSPDGNVKTQLSFAKVFAKYPALVQAIRSDKPERDEDRDDPMHTNTIEVIGREVLMGNEKPLSQGSVLFCMRNLNLVGVLDVDRQELIWYWGREALDRPHCPTLLDNNKLLIFDNGYRRGYSRVIELDPSNNQFATVLSGNSSATPFFSKIMGHAQRLPNGNTLVISSMEFRAFEVTPKGELVWDFRSLLLESDQGKTTQPYRMPRILEAQMPQILLEKWQESRSPDPRDPNLTEAG